LWWVIEMSYQSSLIGVIGSYFEVNIVSLPWHTSTQHSFKEPERHTFGNSAADIICLPLYHRQHTSIVKKYLIYFIYGIKNDGHAKNHMAVCSIGLMVDRKPTESIQQGIGS